MDDFDTLPKMAGWHNSKLTVPNSQLITIGRATPTYNFIFHRPGENGWSHGDKVGALDFNGAEMKFEGDADESAKVFFNHLAKHFQERLKDEYSRGYNDAKQGKEPQR